MTQLVQAWSYSRLNKHRTCPLQSYWLNYAPKGQRIKTPPNPAMVRGKFGHSYCENSINKIMAGIEPPEHHDFGHIVPVLRDLVKVHGQQIHLEQQLAFRQDLTETTWYGKDVWVRVIMDYLGINGSHADMIDWKTGKPRPDDQLELFAGAVFVKYPQIQTVTAYYVFLDHKTTIEKSYNRDIHFLSIWDKFREEVDATIQTAFDEGTWEATPNNLCGWCSVPKTHCHHAKK